MRGVLNWDCLLYAGIEVAVLNLDCLPLRGPFGNDSCPTTSWRQACLLTRAQTRQGRRATTGV
jgi:hypothetical protein